MSMTYFGSGKTILEMSPNSFSCKGSGGVRRALLKKTVVTTHKVTSEIPSTLGDLLAAGCYAEIDDRFKKFDKLARIDNVPANIKTIQFKYVTDTHEIEEELKRRNMEPGTIFDLLAFAAAFPKLYPNKAIVALGSEFQGFDNNWYPFIDCLKTRRLTFAASAAWGGARDWPKDCIFIVSKLEEGVEKVS
jgi:hypothetical protein